MKLHPTRLLPRDFSPGRRRLLKAGLAGAVLLYAGRWLGPGLAAHDGPHYLFLADGDAVILQRIVPVLLRGALPADPAQRQAAVTEVIAGFDRTTTFLAPGVRQELRDLFNLLNLGAVRVLLAGIWPAWDKASDADIAEFLSGWRDSRFALLRSAYTALHDLTMGSWYGNPTSWARIGYRGPPKLA